LLAIQLFTQTFVGDPAWNFERRPYDLAELIEATLMKEER
jgi:hypothetical protein